MDQQAANLLATLRRPSAASESKLTLLNTLKSDIKHYRVPDNAQATIFECLKIAISQQTSTSIVAAAFSTLGHLVKRLKIQDVDGAAIAQHAPRLWPILQERLGDPRESNRTGAAQALSDFWPFCPHEVERIIRDEAITGTHARAKETGLEWVVRMHQDASLQFKSFVPSMVACLEDADGGVRDAAKTALVELFRAASDRAKADLKRQLALHDVRKSITTQILSQIGAAHAPEVDLAASTRSLPALDHLSHFAESLNSEAARPPPQEEVPLDPIYVQSSRELEDLFRDMAACFEGKESEDNWVARDKNVVKIRRITKGNAPSEYHTAYMAGIKTLQDGILKVATSLRTTMATNGCQLVQELARTLGPAIDPMAEIFLQSFIKMSAATKHIASQNGNQTTDTLFQYISYNIRFIQHIWTAAQDKNKSPRMYAAGWLQTVLNRQAGSKTHFEGSGGLELTEKTIKKCLDDNDPKVKESMRAAYWTFAKTWSDRADAIMATLDAKAKLALEKDSHNPNSALAAPQANFGASTTSRTSGARSALRDRIAAARNAAKAQPPRPNTSMATTTPRRAQPMAPPTVHSRVVSASSTASTASRPVESSRTADSSRNTETSRSAESSRPAETSRTVDHAPASSSTATRPNSLMSGAARRPVRRPELSRPATADPYASRRLRSETPVEGSPANSPKQSTTGKTATSSTLAARNRARMASPAASPMRTPAGAQHHEHTEAQPSSRQSTAPVQDEASMINDDFTIEMPNSKSNLYQHAPAASLRQRPVIQKTVSVDTGFQTVAEDDNFTMVLPTSHSTFQHEASPRTHRIPDRAHSVDATGIPLPTSVRSSFHTATPRAQSHSPAPVRSSSATPSQRRHITPERSDTPVADAPPGTIPRQSSPLKSFTYAPLPQEDIHIYEDPFTASTPPRDEPAAKAAQDVSVLTELPPNESNQRAESPAPAPSPTASASSSSPRPHANGIPNGPLSPPQSPQSKAETVRSRKLLESGIERIKARTLDTHGFRKVLDLTRSNQPLDIFGLSGEGKRFDELMGALCDYIVQPIEPAQNNNVANGSTNGTASVRQSQSPELRRQALSILRSLLANPQPSHKKWIANGHWQARTLTAALESRRTIESLGLVVKDLEALVAEVAKSSGRSDECIDAIAAVLERHRADSDTGAVAAGAAADAVDAAAVPELGANPAAKAKSRATALALRALTSLLGPAAEDGGGSDAAFATAASLGAERRASIAALTAQYLRSADAEVRKADVDLATLLFSLWPMEEKRGFWLAMEQEGLLESTRGLLVYFIARRERMGAVGPVGGGAVGGVEVR